MTIPRHPIQSPRWYLSKEVAMILRTEEWRLRNFGSKAYGLQKEIQSPGTGNRRRYFFEVVLKLAVADELYRANITADGIGDALKAIKSQRAIEKCLASYGPDNIAPTLVLVLSEQRNENDEQSNSPNVWERVWKVLDTSQAENVSQENFERGLVAVSLNLVTLWESIVQRIIELEAEGKI